MAKKKQKRSVSKKREFAKKRTEKESFSEQGFFQRLKDVLPQQKKETVRVKTFIVEKPVYVPLSRDKLSPPAQKYNMDAVDDNEKFDSRKSRYSKRRQMEKELLEEKEVPEEELDAVSDDDLGEPIEGEDNEISEDGALSEEGIEGEMSESDLGEEVPVQGATKVRSHGLFTNVWWKKAVLWAFLIWIIILLIELGMQALKLIEVDLTRQWWILLAALVVIEMIYFKFFEGKLSI